MPAPTFSGLVNTATTIVGNAYATAQALMGIAQGATGVNASAIINNGGSIDITASAKALGEGDGAAYATARAFVFEGVAQYASASGTFTTPTSPATDADIVTVGGAALASLTNGATINVGANATATGTISANAYATVGFGVGQLAHASGGTASDHVYNSGTILSRRTRTRTAVRR